MRRTILLLGVIVFLITIGAYAIYNRPKPAVETKFIQVERQASGEAQIKAENPTALVKQPSGSALLPGPTHVYQTFNNCGPATLSMMLSYFGISVSQKELAGVMRPYQNPKGDNDDKTIFPQEFVAWAEKYGLHALHRPNGDIRLLKVLTQNGIPVVVKTWLKVGEDIGHFRIVRGFDEEKKVIIQDDSYQGPNKRIAYYDFLSMWQPFNFGYILIYKAEQEELVKAIIGSEMDEAVAWENALKRAKQEHELDPQNPYPLFNLSVANEHLGNYGESTKAFEKVEARLPRRMLWYQIEPILAYQKLGNHERVFTITEKILTGGNRAFSELYQIRGEIYLARGEEAKAKEQFDLALFYNKNFTPDPSH